MLENATGTAYFDCIQVEEAYAPSNYNLLENSSFELGTNQWDSVNMESGDGMVTANSHNGSSSFKMNGKWGYIKEIFQTVPVSGSESDTYSLGAWAKADAINSTFIDSAAKRFRLIPLVYYTDGSSKWKESISFNPSVSGWQYASGAFNLSDGTNAEKIPSHIKVFVCYHNQGNTVYFDNVSLVKTSQTIYNYNIDGNVISMETNGQTITMEYDANGNLISQTDLGENTTRYQYDSNNNLTKTTSATGISQTATYNNRGQATSSTIQNGTSKKILTNTSYDSAGLFITGITDAHGKTNTFDYDSSTGVLITATDAMGNEINYEYDVSGKLICAKNASIASEYAYDGSHISSITHNNFDYDFTYDGFGNLTKTKAAGRTLSENTYEGRNGKLSEINYGNDSGRVRYIYNDEGSFVGLHKRTETLLGDILGFTLYGYDEKGRVSHEIDLYGRKAGVYTYNSKDLLLRQKIRDVEETYEYAPNNNLKKKTLLNGTSSFVSNYAYDQYDRPAVYQNPSGKGKTFTYDSLGRLTNTSVLTTTPIDTSYTYHVSKRGSAYTTTQLETETLANTGYRYEYDDAGNITLIQKKNASGNYIDHIRYYYDNLYRLVRENNKDLNKTITYTYNSGNNITSKKTYAYTTGSSLGTAQSTVNYGYTNTWKDLLTSYNGQAISYDEIGNPLTYRGAAMTWRARELKSYVGSGADLSYNYDVNGIRTEKKNNATGVTHRYTYINGQLAVEELSNGRTLYFFYDNFGNLAFLRHENNGTIVGRYQVICNSRGDVVALHSHSTGALYATYTYDTWGNVISVKDSSGNDISSSTNTAVLNPIRYRGYYYDSETGFYYLKSRYYDPTTARFINADAYMGEVGDAISHNLFAYCLNNPVMFLDSTGLFPEGFGKNVAYAMVLWGLAAAVENGLNGAIALSAAATIVIAGQAQGIFTNIKVFSKNAFNYGYIVFQLPGETFNVFTKKEIYGISKERDKYFETYRNAIDGFSRKYFDLFAGFVNSFYHYHNEEKEYYDSTYFPPLYDEISDIFQQNFFGARSEIINGWKNLVKRYGVQ